MEDLVLVKTVDGVETYEWPQQAAAWGKKTSDVIRWLIGRANEGGRTTTVTSQRITLTVNPGADFDTVREALIEKRVRAARRR